MHKIRKSVFETNSSSSHSLTMSATDLAPMPFAPHTLRGGVLSVAKGEYGWEWYRYYTAQEKIGYLVTQLCHDDLPAGDERSATQELRDTEPRFDQLCRVVKSHTGVEVVIVPGSSGYIDHDSVGVGLEAFKSDDTLRDFLFSQENYIETGNDNSGPSMTIGSDLGTRDYYGDYYWDPASDEVDVTLVLTGRWNKALTTLKGALLDETHQPDLYRQLMAQGTVTSVAWQCQGPHNTFEYEDEGGYTCRTLIGEDDQKGFRFVRNLPVTVSYTKTANWDDVDTATLKLKVPAALAEALTKLRAPRKKAEPKTAE